jgi:general secretion pathway protein E
MRQGEFIAHLDRKGMLRDGHAVDGGLSARRGLAFNDTDWMSLTKLTASALADELAAFCGCDRVQRRDLLTCRFAGAQLSLRFLREEGLFPFERSPGAVTLAIARPTEDDTIRATEVALRQSVTIVVATADDIEAALATNFDTEQANVAAPPEVAASQDDLDDLRDLARGAPVVRALDEMLRLAVEQRATDLHIEPFDNTLLVRLRIDGLL